MSHAYYIAKVAPKECVQHAWVLHHIQPYPLTLTSLETNEDKSYKVVLFDQSQMFSEKFFYHEKLWLFPCSERL